MIRSFAISSFYRNRADPKMLDGCWPFQLFAQSRARFHYSACGRAHRHRTHRQTPRNTQLPAYTCASVCCVMLPRTHAHPRVVCHRTNIFVNEFAWSVALRVSRSLCVLLCVAARPQPNAQLPTRRCDCNIMAGVVRFVCVCVCWVCFLTPFCYCLCARAWHCLQ